MKFFKKIIDIFDFERFASTKHTFRPIKECDNRSQRLILYVSSRRNARNQRLQKPRTAPGEQQAEPEDARGVPMEGGRGEVNLPP